MDMKSASFQLPPGQEMEHLPASQNLPLYVTTVLNFYDQQITAVIIKKKMLKNSRPGLKCAREGSGTQTMKGCCFQDFFQFRIPHVLQALSPFPRERYLRALPMWVPFQATEQCSWAQTTHLIRGRGDHK